MPAARQAHFSRKGEATGPATWGWLGTLGKMAAPPESQKWGAGVEAPPSYWGEGPGAGPPVSQETEPHACPPHAPARYREGLPQGQV